MEYVKDFSGRILGSLNQQGTRIVAKDFYGRILGYYDSYDNRTRDFYGRILAVGDITSALIAKSDLENK